MVTLHFHFETLTQLNHFQELIGNYYHETQLFLKLVALIYNISRLRVANELLSI